MRTAAAAALTALAHRYPLFAVFAVPLTAIALAVLILGLAYLAANLPPDKDNRITLR